MSNESSSSTFSVMQPSRWIVFVGLYLLVTPTASQTTSQTPSRTLTSTKSPTQSPTAQPTVLSATRFTIDRFGLLGPLSDAPVVSAGAVNAFADAVGTLASTAVLCLSPANPAGLPYRISRIDLLLYVNSTQANRGGISDLALHLRADDADTQGPGAPLGPVFPLTGVAQQVRTTATWFPIDLPGAGWSVDPLTYFWVVLAPYTPLTVPPRVNGFNGVLWGGMNGSDTRLPASVRNSPVLYTGRTLTTQRFAGDLAFGANTTAALNFSASSESWANVPNASIRYTNWAASRPNIRYGIQVIGTQYNVAPPSYTFSSTRSPTQSASLTASASATVSNGYSNSGTLTPTQTGSLSASGTPSQPPSASQTRSGSQMATSTQASSRSQSASQTVSTSQGSSRSQSQSSTQAVTPSRTCTQSQVQTASQAPSRSQTVSASVSQSLTASASSTQSQVGSGTRSMSPSSTLSNTVSLSPTSSLTSTASQSFSSVGTPSGSQTPSQTLTMSSTPSRSSSPSESGTQTQLSSSSQVGSDLHGASPSQSPTLSQLATFSQGSTLSQLSTPSQTSTLTQPPTNSQAATLSQLPTDSQGSTPSQQPTLSQSCSLTGTSSGSPTTSASGSGSASLTATASGAHTPSPSQRPSPSQGSSSTQTPSPSTTVSVSQSPSASAAPAAGFVVAAVLMRSSLPYVTLSAPGSVLFDVSSGLAAAAGAPVGSLTIASLTDLSSGTRYISPGVGGRRALSPAAEATTGWRLDIVFNVSTLLPDGRPPPPPSTLLSVLVNAFSNPSAFNASLGAPAMRVLAYPVSGTGYWDAIVLNGTLAGPDIPELAALWAATQNGAGVAAASSAPSVASWLIAAAVGGSFAVLCCLFLLVLLCLCCLGSPLAKQRRAHDADAQRRAAAMPRDAPGGGGGAGMDAWWWHYGGGPVPPGQASASQGHAGSPPLPLRHDVDGRVSPSSAVAIRYHDLIASVSSARASPSPSTPPRGVSAAAPVSPGAVLPMTNAPLLPPHTRGADASPVQLTQPALRSARSTPRSARSPLAGGQYASPRRGRVVPSGPEGSPSPPWRGPPVLDDDTYAPPPHMPHPSAGGSGAEPSAPLPFTGDDAASMLPLRPLRHGGPEQPAGPGGHGTGAPLPALSPTSRAPRLLLSPQFAHGFSY